MITIYITMIDSQQLVYILTYNSDSQEPNFSNRWFFILIFFKKRNDKYVFRKDLDVKQFEEVSNYKSGEIGR